MPTESGHMAVNSSQEIQFTLDHVTLENLGNRGPRGGSRKLVYGFGITYSGRDFGEFQDISWNDSILWM
jgi:hypothetical protein